MKYRNLRKATKVFMFCTFIISILSGCNQIKSQNTNSNIIIENKQEYPNNTTKSTYNGEWQLIARARYIQGKVVSLKQSSDGKYILNLKVEVNYHSGTDQIEDKNFPFKIGEVIEFTLKYKPKISLINNKRIIIYQGQVTTDGKNDFLGAVVKYYEDKGKYFDMNGMKINLPPKDYPSNL